MSCAKVLTLIGLVFNTLAAVVLIIPNLSLMRNVEDEYIQITDADGKKYAQNKHIREQKINLIGLFSLSIGFILQLLAVLLF